MPERYKFGNRSSENRLLLRRDAVNSFRQFGPRRGFGGGEMKNDNLGRSRDRIRVVVVCAAYRLRACSARLAGGRRRARDTKTN